VKFCGLCLFGWALSFWLGFSFWRNAFLDFVVIYVRKKIKIGVAKFVGSFLLVNIFYAKGGQGHIESVAGVRSILGLALPQLHEHATAAAASHSHSITFAALRIRAETKKQNNIHP
jgi:hypothetical protein